MKRLYLLSILIVCLSCKHQNASNVTIQSKNTSIDSIYITESITNKVIAGIPVINTFSVIVEPEYLSIGEIETADYNNTFLTILRPGKQYNIRIETDSTISTDNVGDSLLNYLWKSNNEFISQNAGFIFSTDDSDSLFSLFENFRKHRLDKINSHSHLLTPEEKKLLTYQNDARIYSFLFYFGRIVRKYIPDSNFFKFIEKIDNSDLMAMSLPHNLLYKHEIEYINASDSLTSADSFINYLESQTSNKRLSNFLKAIYLTEIIESPSYWEKHQKLFNSVIISETIEREKDNPFYYLIDKSSRSFFSSQKGENAYDFTAQRMDGTEIKLSDMKGKVVFIDSWASWCGPCIRHRPAILELAKKYENNPNVEVLMISIDASKEDWTNYLFKRNEANKYNDFIIENGMRTEYGARYNINSIPKYILIGQDGLIIDANIAEPSQKVELMVEDALKNG